MSNMNQEQTIERICRRIHGEMTTDEAAQFDLDLESNPRLARTYRQMCKLDTGLSHLPVEWPSMDFTAVVLQKTKPRVVILPAKEKASWLDWTMGLAPAFCLLIIALIWGEDLWGRAVGEMSQSAGWLDHTLGTQVFANQPFLLLGALIPVAILGVAYAILHENYRAEA